MRAGATDGTATYTRLTAAGPFGAVVRVSFACPWISGDAPSVDAPPTNFPLIAASLYAGDVVDPFGSGAVVSVATLPPPYVLYNTPLLPLGVQLTYTLSNGTRGLAWRAIVEDTARLRCTLAASLDGAAVVASTLRRTGAGVPGGGSPRSAMKSGTCAGLPDFVNEQFRGTPATRVGKTQVGPEDHVGTGRVNLQADSSQDVRSVHKNASRNGPHDRIADKGSVTNRYRGDA